MNRSFGVASGAAIVAALTLPFPVEAQQGLDTLQEKIAAAERQAAQNQQALCSYTWIEKTELSHKGEIKNTRVQSCRYGPDGTVEKTEIADSPPAKKKRGLRERVIEKKKKEMQEELEAAASLVHSYVPPDCALMQVVIGAGQLSF